MPQPAIGLLLSILLASANVVGAVVQRSPEIRELRVTLPATISELSSGSLDGQPTPCTVRVSQRSDETVVEIADLSWYLQLAARRGADGRLVVERITFDRGKPMVGLGQLDPGDPNGSGALRITERILAFVDGFIEVTNDQRDLIQKAIAAEAIR